MKNGYKKILLAVELRNSDKPLIEKAQAIAKMTGAKIYLVHAIEHIGTYSAAGYGIVDVAQEIEKELIKKADKDMEKIGKLLNVPKKNQLLEIGTAKIAVLEEADEIKADLILIGSRGQEGVRMLLGSTANAVLHHAKCDVLAVRIK